MPRLSQIFVQGPQDFSSHIADLMRSGVLSPRCYSHYCVFAFLSFKHPFHVSKRTYGYSPSLLWTMLMSCPENSHCPRAGAHQAHASPHPNPTCSIHPSHLSQATPPPSYPPPPSPSQGRAVADRYNAPPKDTCTISAFMHARCSMSLRHDFARRHGSQLVIST
jgi:hypothetical protein